MAKYYIMALSIECLENMRLEAPSNETSVGSTEIALQQGVTFSLDTQIGSVDRATFAVRSNLSPDTLHDDILPGFAAYRKADGIFSRGLYKSIMNEVMELRKPGEREKYKFTKSTMAQIKGFEFRLNNPFPATSKPPGDFHLAQEQIDAYCLLREDCLPISEVALSSDHILFEQIIKMPNLGNSLPQQEQSQILPAAA